MEFRDLEKENNLLSSHQFDLVVLMTSAGITDQDEATLKHTGQKILGLIYRDNTSIQIQCFNEQQQKDYYFFTALRGGIMNNFLFLLLFVSLIFSTNQNFYKILSYYLCGTKIT